MRTEYAEIVKHLDSLAAKGAISAYTRKILLEMSNKVIDGVAAEYGKVKEGVKSIMGGRILEYEAKTIFNEGRQEGFFQALTELVRDGVLSVAEAARRAGLSEEAFLGKI